MIPNESISLMFSVTLKRRTEIITIVVDLVLGLLLGLAVICFGTAFPPSAPGDFAPISNALATGIITLVGLTQAFFLSREQARLQVKKRTLESFIERVEHWRQRPNTERVLGRMYERAVKSWTREILRIDISFNILYVLLAAFLIFIMVSLSSSSPQLSVIELDILSVGKMSLPIFFFYAGLSLLILLLYTHILIVGRLRRITIPKKGRGELWIRSVNDVEFRQRQDEIEYDATGVPEIVLRVSFSGYTTHGFLDTRVEFENGTQVFVPDRNTFMCDFWNVPRIVLNSRDLAFETGVIQGKCCFDNTQSLLTFPLEQASRDYRELGFWTGREGYRVRRLYVGIYEDPLFLPSDRPRGTGRRISDPTRDRYKLDEVTVNLQYNKL